MDQVAINEKIGANYILLELTGSINAYTITEFEEKVYNNIKKTNVVLDLSKVVSIDSSGLGVIMAGFNDGTKYNKKLFLMNPSESAKRAIDSTGFNDTFNFIHSVTEVD